MLFLVYWLTGQQFTCEHSSCYIQQSKSWSKLIFFSWLAEGCGYEFEPGFYCQESWFPSITASSAPRLFTVATFSFSDLFSLLLWLNFWFCYSVGTNMGEVIVWELVSRERIAYRNFKVWELGSCSMPLQVCFLKFSCRSCVSLLTILYVLILLLPLVSFNRLLWQVIILHQSIVSRGVLMEPFLVIYIRANCHILGFNALSCAVCFKEFLLCGALFLSFSVNSSCYWLWSSSSFFNNAGVAYSKHIVHIYSYHAPNDLRNHLEVCVLSSFFIKSNILISVRLVRGRLTIRPYE